MLVTIRFIKRKGDGLFGRLEYQDVVCSNVECRDLEHAGIRAAATMRKHWCGMRINGAYFPYAFVTLENGEVYRISVSPNNSTPIVESK